MNVLYSLRSEILKTKRTAAFYFTLAGAAVIPVLFLFNVFSDGLPNEDKFVKDPLNAMFKLAADMNSIAIFPFFVILVCTLLPQIEHKNNTWKQVLTSPQTKVSVFTAKFLNIHLLILLFLAASHLFMWLVVLVTHFVLPKLHLLNQPFDGKTVLVNTVDAYATLLAVGAIQFWIGLRFKNFIIPIAIGFALWLMGTVLVLEYKSNFANYFPYSFHVFSSFAAKSRLPQIEWTSLGYAVLVLPLAFLDFRRRRMIG